MGIKTLFDTKMETKRRSILFYTKRELKTLYLIFGHQSSETRNQVIRRANGTNRNEKVSVTLEKMKDNCKFCKEITTTNRRFKLTVCTE